MLRLSSATPPRIIALLLASGVACSRPSAAPADAEPAASAPSPSTVASSVPSVTVVHDAAVDTVTHASALDAGGAVLVGGRVDANALRAASHARYAKEAGTVTMLTGGGALELGERLCDKVVPTRPPSTPVLLKPNLGGFDWFRDPAKSDGDDGVKGRITDPEFVRGVIRCLKKRGHQRITVAEGWGATHKDWLRLIKVSGYLAMTTEEKVPLVAMDDDGVFDVEGDKPGLPLAAIGMESSKVPTLLVPKILAEHLQNGLYLSLPKIKAHRFGVVSVGLKATQGTVMLSDAAPAFRQKWRMHRELGPLLDGLATKPNLRERYVAALDVFAERIADVFEVETPHAILAEGAFAMGGDGFGTRTPIQPAVAIGGTNAVYVDKVAASWLGLYDNEALGRELLGRKSSPLLVAVAKRYGLDPNAAVVEGDGAALLRAPRPMHYLSMAGFELRSSAPPPPTDDHARPTLHAAHVDGLQIDGVVEAAWDKAPSTQFSTDYRGVAANIPTRVRAAWSSAGLSFVFQLEKAGLFADRTQPKDRDRAKLWAEDCVEIFLTPDARRRSRYFEIELGPFGHFLDLEVDREKKGEGNVAWSSQPKIATAVDEAAGTVVIEATLAAPELRTLLSAGASLPLALYRIEGQQPRVYLAWSPPRTSKPNFHVPEAFGTLVLGP